MYFNLLKKHYRIFPSFFLCLLFFFSFLFSSSVFAEGGGAAGGTAAPISGCGSSPKNICYSSWNTGGEGNSQGGGGEWVYITMKELLERNLITDPDSISYKAIRRGIPVINQESARHLDYAGDSQMIRGCGKADGVYAFISHRYHNNAPVFTPTGDAYGPNKFAYFHFPHYKGPTNRGENTISPEKKYVNRAGPYHVEYDKAEKEFQKYLDYTKRNDLKWDDGEFSWFCSYGEPEKKCDPNDPTCDQNKKPDCDPNTDPTCNNNERKRDCSLDDPTCKPKGPDICNALVPGVVGSVYKGNTAALSQVVNLSYTGTESFKKWQSLVLARPGDSIRFRHALCYPAQGVAAGLDKSDKTLTATAGSPGLPNHFNLYASRNDDGDNRYLFKDSALADGNTRSVHTQSKNAIQGAGIISADYGFYTESPSSPNPPYSCDSPIFIQNNNRAITNGFQIPGFASGISNCNSATQTGSSTEVGNKISQGIFYNDVKSWVSSVTKVSGECSCGVNSAKSEQQTDKPYEKAGIFESRNSNGSIANEDVVGISEVKDEALNGHPGNHAIVYPNGGPRLKGTSWGSYKYTCEGDGSCEEGSRTRYKTSSPRSVHYPVSSKDYGERSTKASVVTPYNFNTYVTSSIDSDDVVFSGERVNISGSYHILSRSNTMVAKNPYATHTSDKETFRIYELLIPPHTSLHTLSGSDRSDQDVCRYYGSDNCHLVKAVKGVMNPEGNYNGSDQDSDIFSRTVPDNGEYVGYKYCTATSIWPASSHNTTTNTIDNNISGPAISGGDETKFNVSDLSCVTIAKKPNFQVWGGGMFTNGQIETAVSRKTPGQSFSSYPSAAEKVFGSWDEYHVVAGGRVYGFGSGASLGYEKGYNYNLPTGGSNPSNNIYNLTIANRKNIGESGVYGLPSGLLSRLKARYRDNIAKNSSLKITTHDTGLQNTYIRGDVNLSQIQLPDHNPKATDTLFRTYDTLYKTITTADKQNNTLVLYVDGTLTIDQNLCYSAFGGNNCQYETSTKQAAYTDVSTESITKLPQILIFAKNINVLSKVNRVDAWLILDEDNASNNLNTCSDVNEPSAEQCSETIIFNGPVFAKSLTLKRTGGANHGGGLMAGIPADQRVLGTRYDKHEGGYYAISSDGSVAPAEIFNLRSDAYYWGVGQAQRSGIAEVVYQRELAPRY
ncbi:hypothetical protein [Candidatus Nanosyncoccus nanoralicus]|uniref:Uncharacterized protein n=1 Tax=Candidatus Nanosyncoccus nanoralicus TaxID=2171996 RepID=A0ABY0FJN2_9BACT|nr:hypothetical protein [Candidatus Nanosyncoccus nanoralicus]RYC73330.1 hypothetical protein G3KMM_00451 [Candidatus Nanosyncoccus nanoralicus]